MRTFLIKKEIEDIERYWNDLIYSVCGGDVTDMAALKKYDVFDFFSYIDKKSKDG